MEHRLFSGSGIYGDRTVVWIFIKALALIYLAAFLSLAVQIQGLIGSEGIQPAHHLLDVLAGPLGSARYLRIPTLFWINSSDTALSAVCYGGALISCLLMIGVFPPFLLFVLWALYLSLMSVGSPFLDFQWDNLLLEVGFATIFVAPWKWYSLRSGPEPPRAGIWLIRLVLFKLLLMSGLVKLLSGDSTWLNLTALTYHYQTQPLPTWIAWYAHQFPLWFQKFSTVLMFFEELIIPYTIFFSRRWRLFGFFNIVGFQIIIMLTGNYGFFNLLTILLALSLLDNSFLEFISKSSRSPSPQPSPLEGEGRVRGIRSLFTSGFLIFFIIMSFFQFSGRITGGKSELVSSVLKQIAPFRTINRYGLFAVMTRDRPEIIIEGSNDGVSWKAIPFKWKPGDLQKPPRFCMPHMPRLDWQMWFAALGNEKQNSWVKSLVAQILHGNPTVLKLLGPDNPFTEQPPAMVRVLLYEYEFTDFKIRQQTGEWWSRKWISLYLPVFHLDQK